MLPSSELSDGCKVAVVSSDSAGTVVCSVVGSLLSATAVSYTHLVDMDRITIRTLATFRKSGETKEMLLDITEDGVIDDNEKPQMCIRDRNLSVYLKKKQRRSELLISLHREPSIRT